jgi:putative phosphoesterase
MKTLILSDIHGNLPALEAVLEQEKNYEVCLFLGDVVDYGPFPNECIAFLEQEMDFGVIGNHDNALAYGVECGCRGDFKKYSEETRAWHKTLLGKSEIGFLRSLQPLNQVTIDGNSLVLAHASPQKGDLFRYLVEDEVDEALAGITAQIVLLGHTHVQFRKHVGNTLVVNPGSVGLARDGGQACYAILESGVVSLKRLAYDVNETIKALLTSPISQECKKGLSQVLRGE